MFETFRSETDKLSTAREHRGRKLSDLLYLPVIDKGPLAYFSVKQFAKGAHTWRARSCSSGDGRKLHPAKTVLRSDVAHFTVTAPETRALALVDSSSRREEENETRVKRAVHKEGQLIVLSAVIARLKLLPPCISFPRGSPLLAMRTAHAKWHTANARSFVLHLCTRAPSIGGRPGLV